MRASGWTVELAAAATNDRNIHTHNTQHTHNYQIIPMLNPDGVIVGTYRCARHRHARVHTTHNTPTTFRSSRCSILMVSLWATTAAALQGWTSTESTGSQVGWAAGVAQYSLMLLWYMQIAHRQAE